MFCVVILITFSFQIEARPTYSTPHLRMNSKIFHWSRLHPLEQRAVASYLHSVHHFEFWCIPLSHPSNVFQFHPQIMKWFLVTGGSRRSVRETSKNLLSKFYGFQSSLSIFGRQILQKVLKIGENFSVYTQYFRLFPLSKLQFWYIILTSVG